MPTFLDLLPQGLPPSPLRMPPTAPSKGPPPRPPGRKPLKLTVSPGKGLMYHSRGRLGLLTAAITNLTLQRFGGRDRPIIRGDSLLPCVDCLSRGCCKLELSLTYHLPRTRQHVLQEEVDGRERQARPFNFATLGFLTESTMCVCACAQVPVIPFVSLHSP